MKKITYNPGYGEKTSNIYEVDDTVWVMDFETPWQEYECGPVVRRLKVAAQEWWEGNSYIPVYYDLVDPDTGETVGVNGPGNHHFAEIFETEEKAIDELLIFVNNEIKFFESEGTQDKEDILRYEKFKKLRDYYNSQKEKNA